MRQVNEYLSSFKNFLNYYFYEDQIVLFYQVEIGQKIDIKVKSTFKKKKNILWYLYFFLYSYYLYKLGIFIGRNKLWLIFRLVLICMLIFCFFFVSCDIMSYDWIFQDGFDFENIIVFICVLFCVLVFGIRNMINI